MGDRAGWRGVLCLFAVVALLAASGQAAAFTAATNGATAADGLDCTGSDDGTVFRTSSGLEVIHDGRYLLESPFVNETTLAFPNVTVRASDDASLRVASASERGLCVRDVKPTDAAIEISPAAGPRIVVSDDLGALSYGAVEYARAANDSDLSYSAKTPARIVVADARLQPGRTVQAVDAEARTVLDAGRVSETRALELRLPADTGTVDLRYAPTVTETQTVDSAGDGVDPDGAGTGAVAVDGSTTDTETERTPNGSTQPSRSSGWTAELVDYQPSPQTQHVGGFLPLTVLLWLLALWLLIARDSRETRVLALVLVVASVRATSDLLQVTLDGFVGIETSIAAINLLLELSLALLFVQFAAVYVDEHRLRTRRAKWGMVAVATLGTASVLTNPVHGFVFADTAVAGGPFTYVTTTAGPGGWFLFALNMGLLVAGGGLILRSLLGPSVRTVWQPVAVIGTGLCLAVLLGVVSVLDRGPVAGYDYTASGVNYFVFLTAVTLLAHGLKRLKTSGEKSVIADLEDAIVILDDTWAVVEFNPAAGRLLPDVGTGRSFDAVLEEPLERPAVGETSTTELSLLVDASAADTTAEPVTSTDGGEDVSQAESGGEGADQHGTAGGRASRDPLADVTGDNRTDDPHDGGDERRHGSSPESGAAMPERSGQDRERKHFLVKATTVTTETNAIIGYTVRFADVTHLERHMRRLEAKNDQLDRFASAITHDLRTPLTAAENITDRAVEILEEGGNPETVDRSRLSASLQQIEDALNRMADVIEDILGLARGSDIELDPHPVEFDGIVESTWETVDSSGTTLRLESSGEISADPDQLQGLLERLFQNSIDHGGRDATVRVGLDDSGFYVADDGPGVPEEVRNELFEVGVTTKAHGSGLGLAIAEQVANAHGWEIGLDADGEGARFVVTGCDTSPDRDAPPEVNG